MFFALGIVIFQYFPVIPSIYWLVFLVIITIVLLFLKKSQLNPILFFILGFSWAFIFALWHYQTLDQNYINENIRVFGVITEIPKQNEYSQSVHFKVEKARYQNRIIKIPSHLLLFLNKNIEIHADERWHFIVNLKPASGFYNPGGFNYEKWLWTQKITTIGQVKGGASKINDYTGFYSIHRLRETLALSIHHEKYQGIIKALSLGIRQDIPNQHWQTFLITGTNHLIAISGLHITLVYFFVFTIINFIWRRISLLNLWQPAIIASSILSFIFAFIYAALAGFAIPTQRALIMLLVFIIILTLKIPIRPLYLLNTALIIICIIDPLAILTASFWLSFIAVAIIFYAITGHLSSYMHKFIKYIKDLFYLQLYLSIGLIPLTLFFFHQISLIAPVANIIAVPWMSFIVVPFALLGLVFPFFLTWAGFAIELLIQFLNYLASLPFARWQQYQPPLWTLLPAIMAIFLLLAPKGFPGRWLAIIFILPLFIVLPEKPKENTFWLSFLEVGQDIAVIIQAENYTMAYLDINENIKKQVLEPFLLQNNIKKIDMVIQNNKINDKETCDQRKWQQAGIDFEILYPPKNYHSIDVDCVIKISNGKYSVLLAPKLNYLAESLLLQYPIQADILLVPNQGSIYTSSLEFIQKVKPHYAVFSVGFLNKYALPNTTIVNRYQNFNAKILRTDKLGMIQFKINEKAIITSFYREKYRYYWSR